MSFKQVWDSQYTIPAIMADLKKEIETWVKAVGQYDNHEFEEALNTFQEISDTAKILFNCGVIHATLGQHDKAVSIVSL